ncbi:MAG: DUF3341 domain-containing protein [Calditrichaeota bacterium]|nr:DUF3341 domain-containing protein [Calditrichota bacterium]MBT7616183.1 DUF3341 domain-containing protein [Calditrichota bacterium]MBT7788998.1 DUF3341 domain-containing protein [Calditrichota bacterium]
MSKTKSRTAGCIAEFAGPGELLKAAEKVRDAGYKDFDCHSPFPIHGMDEAMGEKGSMLGPLVGLAAFLGGSGALLMQWWMSAVDYKVVIAGKPFFSYQAFFPVTFSLAVLFSAGMAVVGMLSMIKLRFHHPVFYSERFKKASDDMFFISVLSDDPIFSEEKTQLFLESIGGAYVEALRVDDE